MKTSNDIEPGPFSGQDLRQRWNEQADEHNQWDQLDSCEQLAWAQTEALASGGWIVPSSPDPTPPEPTKAVMVDRGGGLLMASTTEDSSATAPPASPSVDGAKVRTITVQTPSFEEMRDWILREGQFSPCGTELLQCLMLMTPPAKAEPAPPADREVAELVEWLQQEAALRRPPGLGDALHPERWAALVAEAKLTRAVELLQQRNPAPVAVSERLPKASSKVLAYYVNELGMGRTICAIWVPAKSRSDDADLDDDDFLEYDEQTDEYYWPEGWYEAIENWDDLGYIKVNEGEIIYWQPLPDWHATVLPMPAGDVQP